MKKYIISIFIITCCLGISKAQKITHNVQLNFFGAYTSTYDTRFTKERLNCSLLSYGMDNFVWNLIPTYELGYKNKWFFKLEHSYIGMAYGDLLQQNLTYEERTHYINFYASYNLFPIKWTAHRLKLGIGPGLYQRAFDALTFDQEWILWERDLTCKFVIGAELSYLWTVYKGLYVGFEASYIQSLTKRVYTYDYKVAMGITVGYTFNFQPTK